MSDILHHDNHFIPIIDYQIQSCLSETKQKKVYEAINKQDGKKVLVKVFHLPIDNYTRANFLKKLDVFNHIDFPGIAKVIGYRLPLQEGEEKGNSESDSNGYVIAYDFFENGSIEDLTKRYINSDGKEKDKMNPTIRSKIIFGIAATMKHLHKYYLSHKNLKLSNIILNDKLEPLITDFSSVSGINFSEVSLSLDNENINLYTAPEVINNNDDICSVNCLQADVYSFAMILYFLFSSEVVFSNLKPGASLFRKIMNITRGFRPEKPDLMPDHYFELVEKCWDADAEKRPTFQEITEILRDDRFALEEFGMKTDMEELHEYQDRIDADVEIKI